MAPGIKGLPPEVLGRICSFLPRDCLKSFRTVSRAADAAAQRILFETVFLRSHDDSFNRLIEISEHPRIRRYVRTIFWDGRVIEGFEEVQEIPCFDEYVEHTVPEALLQRDTEATRANLFGQLSETQVLEIYAQYLKYVTSQCLVMAGTYMNRTLRGILSRFDGLTGVHYDLDGGRSIWNGETPLEYGQLSDVAKKTLVELDGTHSSCTRNFWTLLGAVRESGRARQLRYLSGQVDIAFWDQVVEACATLTGLERFLLEMELMPCTDPADEHIDAALLLEHLSLAVDLRVLELRFSARRPDMLGTLPVISLSCPRVHLSNLQYLLLEGIVTSERGLSGLLRNHSPTLRGLLLESVRFERANADDGQEPDCWIRFIHFLSEEMSLQNVKFVRCWQATPIMFSCSLHIWQDIEMYITGHGPCPLRSLNHPNCRHDDAITSNDV